MTDFMRGYFCGHLVGTSALAAGYGLYYVLVAVL